MIIETLSRLIPKPLAPVFTKDLRWLCSEKNVSSLRIYGGFVVKEKKKKGLSTHNTEDVLIVLPFLLNVHLVKKFVILFGYERLFKRKQKNKNNIPNFCAIISTTIQT